ncbi:MAG TPA: hypothetical protein VNU22_06035 [Candidatus Acidoferrum sp.]|nr:hypothetical protein [Candidatus Acidoferrum sp.]
MRSLDFSRYALSSCVAVAMLAGCGGSQPPIGAPGTQGRIIETVRQKLATPVMTDRPRLLAVTRKIEGNIETSYLDKVVKVREYTLPGKQVATDSIIVGPDRNLWFTEWCGIAQITLNGQIRVTKLRPGQSDPGLLTVGPDGDIWANAAQDGTQCLPPTGPLYLVVKLIYRVTPEGRLTAFPLPIDNNNFPTGLLNTDSTLYFGLPILAIIHGDEVDRNFLATISTTDGIVNKVAPIHESRSTGDGYIMALGTPGPKMWFYDFEGGLHVCSTTGKCFYRRSPTPHKFVGALYGTAMAYSSADQDVYIDDQNTWIIVRYTLGGKRSGGYKNLAFANGFGTVTYYHGNIWITLGGDDKARPNLGRLTPSGDFSEVSLPFVGPTAAVTALVGGPNGHLWYLRGNHVGEILSNI